MNETLVADEWIHTTLTADATLMGLVGGVWQDAIPPDDTTTALSRPWPNPHVVYFFQGGSDLMIVNATRIWSDGVWVIKAVDDRPSYSRMVDVDDRIEAALHRQSGTVSGGTVWTAVRETPFRLAENIDGTAYRHLGGTYRIQAQRS